MSKKNKIYLLTAVIVALIGAIALISVAVLQINDEKNKALATLHAAQTADISLADEFNGSQLDPLWDTFRGFPTINSGHLILEGADIQSKELFQLGSLQGVVQSSDWKPHDQFTDSSFGFEIWTGTNGKCHYAVTFKATGHLAVLRSEPDASGNCSGDPIKENQAYISITNWDTVRQSGTIHFVLIWLSDGVTLCVNDGDPNNKGLALYTGQALPVVPMKLRLYAHAPDSGASETYRVDYVRLNKSNLKDLCP